MIEESKKLFEDNFEQIQKLAKIHSAKWKMRAIPSIDRQDIEQMLLTRVSQKIHLYKKDMPLGNWLSRVFINAMKNILRDYYYKFNCVCVNCPSNTAGQCKIYGEIESPDCNIFMKWVKEKKFHHDCALPVTLEDHRDEIYSMPSQDLNFEEQIAHLKHKLQDKLSILDYKIFSWCYIENKSDNDIIRLLNYKNERLAKKQIANLKQNIVVIVKNILNEE